MGYTFTPWLPREQGNLMNKLFGTMCTGEWVIPRKIMVWLLKEGRRDGTQENCCCLLQSSLWMQRGHVHWYFSHSNQWFPKFSMHQDHPEGWSQHGWLCSSTSFWCISPGTRIWDSEFLEHSSDDADAAGLVPRASLCYIDGIFSVHHS